jgi:hypothetical protein
MALLWQYHRFLTFTLSLGEENLRRHEILLSL